MNKQWGDEQMKHWPIRSFLAAGLVALCAATGTNSLAQANDGASSNRASQAVKAEAQASLDVVQRFLAAQAAGDAEGMVALMADDVRWRVPGDPSVPWVGVHQGKPAVVSFLQTFAAEIEPLAGGGAPTLVAQGENVILLTDANLRVRRNGAAIRGPMIVHYVVRDSLVAVHDVYEDGFAVSEAWRAPAATPLR